MNPSFQRLGVRSRSWLSRLASGTSAIIGLLVLLPATTLAAPSVSWTSPPDNSVFNVGTLVQPTGQAAGTVTGAGLDLTLVLDRSGSMGINATSDGVTKTRRQWQADAAIALATSLPTVATSVAIVEYASSGFVRLPLTPTTATADIVNAINQVPASGGTAIHAGIDVALGELNTNGTAGRSRQMVVISDGGSNVTLAVNATNAAVADNVTVHGVVIPRGNISTMQAIATAGGGIFADFSDTADLAGLESFFSAGGGFVGLDKLDLTLPDGTVLADYPTDAFGNFVVNPAWEMLAGSNQFLATATFLDGTVASATLNLNGVTNGVQPVPTPAPMALMVLGLGLVGLFRHRRLQRT